MILTIGPGGCGFTFLNWSISFLRGDIHYKTLTEQIINVDIDPLEDFNAHKFSKDHIRPNSTQNNLLEKVNDQSIIYAVPADSDNFLQLLSIPGKKIIFDNQVYTDQLLARHYVAVPNSLYKDLVNELSSTYSEIQVKKVLLDSSKFFISDCYTIPKDYDCFVINYKQMFETLDYDIVRIFNFLKLPMDNTRFDKWVKVYQQYQSKNQHITKHYFGTDSITNSLDQLKILKEIINWRNGLYQNT